MLQQLALDTVVRWHRDWLRCRWARHSKLRPDGCPHPDRQIRALVREMATASPLWRAPRIHGELRTLGVDISESTVSRLLERHPRPPSQTWRTFLTNHLTSAALEITEGSNVVRNVQHGGHSIGSASTAQRYIGTNLLNHVSNWRVQLL